MPPPPRELPTGHGHSGNARTAFTLAGVVVAMVGMAYAAVPLYDLFCRTTGYGGTTQRSETGADRIIDREIVVRFDANVSGLPWEFRPVQPQVQLKAGETGIATFVAVNRSDVATAGSATFNVTPDAAGAYFNKIECFCFTRQDLEPGASVEMGVQFFVDPAIAEDGDLDATRTITLSYSFFPVASGSEDPKPGGSVARSAGQPVAQTVADEPNRKL